MSKQSSSAFRRNFGAPLIATAPLPESKRESTGPSHPATAPAGHLDEVSARQLDQVDIGYDQENANSYGRVFCLTLIKRW